MPKNLGPLLRGFKHILVPEMNSGQLKTVLRDQFLVDAQPLSKVSGQPFRIAEIEAAIEGALAMKPINPWPMILMLVVVVVLIVWLSGAGR